MPRSRHFVRFADQLGTVADDDVTVDIILHEKASHKARRGSDHAVTQIRSEWRKPAVRHSSHRN